MGQEKYATWSTVISILTKEVLFLHIKAGLLLSDTFLCHSSEDMEKLKAQVHSRSGNWIAPFPRDVIPQGAV